MPTKPILLTCLAMLGVATVARAETAHFATNTFTAPKGARSAVTADFDGDGIVDLATANTLRNTVVVWHNQGDGVWSIAREIAVNTGPFDLATGDLNRDGTPDLVVTTPDANTLEVILFARGGTVAAHTVATIGQSRGVTLADINRDGILDIVYSNYVGGTVHVLRGNGSGVFTAAGQATVGARPQGIKAADFNHDGFIDLAVASNNTNGLDILYGTSTGGFTRQSIDAGRTLNVLAVADVDADGWADIAAVSTNTNVVAMFRGGPSGFGLAGTRPVGSSPRGIDSGDFDRDGRPDFAVGNRDSGSVTVLIAHDGTVLPDVWGTLAAGAGARPIVTGDFDRNGTIDFAAPSELDTSLKVFRNATAFIRTGFAYHRQILGGTQFGTRTVAADFNENGKPDLLANRVVLLEGTAQVDVNTNLRDFERDVATGDFDRDGHADAIFTMFNPDQAFEGVVVYRGNGRGGFTQLARIGGMPGARNIRVGDLDRDGRLDAVVTGANPGGGGALYVYRQASATIASYALSGFAVDVQLADVNADGWLDVLVSHGDPHTIEVRLGTGSGAFGPPSSIAFPWILSQFVAADLNGDGRADVATSTTGFVYVAFSTETGWTTPAEYRIGDIASQADGLMAGDFNNDGAIDLFTSGGAFLPGTGDGVFGSVEEFEIHELNSMAAVDMNGDGLLDVVSVYEAILNERRAENRPPVANAEGDRTFPYHAQFAQEDGSLFGGLSTDPDVHRLSYEWRDETGHVFARSEVANFEPRRPGSYQYSLTVNDNRGGQDTVAFTLTITPEPEIVLYAGARSQPVGNWVAVQDSTAAGNFRVFYPNANAPKVNAPSANPASYVDVPFVADPTQTYKLWVRLKAENNYWGNDSVWLQFDGAANTSGQPVYRIGTTSGVVVNLEECSGCGISGWGWEDDGWGAVNVNGPLYQFPAGGFQTLRIQIREDGVSIDQIVLSAVKYRSNRPGKAKNDTLILMETQQFPE